jgi:hypothetical protein
MSKVIRRYAATLSLLIASLALSGQAAKAQQQVTGIGGSAANMATGRSAAAAPTKPAPPAPAGLPGAKAKAPVAPPTKPVADMSPNEALFDAINRGDMAAARDAVNRGADLNAVNVLGMTPMDMAVDLWRSDIAFMLLSLRGDDAPKAGTRTRTPATNVAGTPKPAPKQPAVAKIPAQNPLPGPKLWANDGGSPQPADGFLGFGGRPAAN